MEDMMRKMMIAASLTAFAACGSVQDPNESGDDGGDAIDPDAGTDDGEADSPTALIAFGPSKVRDERGDLIDFSSTDPIHTHGGTEVDLSSGECPAVYKYAYLMDAAPPFGSSSTSNPLAFRVVTNAAQLDAASATFRVRNDAGESVLAWAPLPAGSNGVHDIVLTRHGGTYPIAQLGTRTGKFYVDLRARDISGNETMVSTCWEHHPLAAPLAVSPVEKDELFAMSLPANSAVSRLIDFNSPPKVGVVGQKIVQHTAEPITITWSATIGEAQYTKRTFNDYATQSSPASFGCPSGTVDPRCKTFVPTHQTPAVSTASGAVTPAYVTIIRDETTGQIVHSAASLTVTWQVPARGANEPPHAYRMIVQTGGLGELRPPDMNLWGFDVMAEHTVMGLVYTGVAPLRLGDSCGQIQSSPFGPLCTRVDTYWRFSALDQVTLAFESIASKLQTSLGANQPGSDVTYVPPATWTLGAVTWDSGDDDLPGQY